MERLARLAPRAVVLTNHSALSLVYVRSKFSSMTRQSNTNTDQHKRKNSEDLSTSAEKKPSAPDAKPQKTQSMVQADEELRRRLEEMSGEGGAAGVEYEDGKPQAMKRSVRNNMFRYI